MIRDRLYESTYLNLISVRLTWKARSGHFGAFVTADWWEHKEMESVSLPTATHDKSVHWVRVVLSPHSLCCLCLLMRFYNHSIAHTVWLTASKLQSLSPSPSTARLAYAAGMRCGTETQLERRLQARSHYCLLPSEVNREPFTKQIKWNKMQPSLNKQTFLHAQLKTLISVVEFQK